LHVISTVFSLAAIEVSSSFYDCGMTETFCLGGSLRVLSYLFGAFLSDLAENDGGIYDEKSLRIRFEI
jgi:hypothetical protein